MALAREVERRVPELATSKWWKEERHGVFVDYNQNMRDRTVASAYSVRPTPDARVSTPLRWDEVSDVEAAELRIDTVPDRIARHGDPSADIDCPRRIAGRAARPGPPRRGGRPQRRPLAAQLPQAARRAETRTAESRSQETDLAALSLFDERRTLRFMRIISHPPTEQLSLPGVLYALSDPVRLEIVGMLDDEPELSCGRINVPVSKSTLSHHLKVLREAGLTLTRAEGVQRFVSLRRCDVESRFPGLLSCVLTQAERRAMASTRGSRP